MAMHRGRIRVTLLALGLVVGTVWLLWAWPSLTRGPIGPPRHPLPDTVVCNSNSDSSAWRDFGVRFLGHPETSVIERFGQPTHQWKGHYAAPPVSYQRTYPNP